MASSLRCWMSLACDCWMQSAWEAPQLSASLMAVEQQFSASLIAWTQLASASLRVRAQLASASLMEWMQMAFASLMDSVVSDSFCQRVILKSATSFHQWVSVEDLVASKSPRALLASSWRWATPKGGALPLDPGVLAVGEETAGISSREASSISVSSGALTWDDVSTSLVRSSHLGGRGWTRTMDSNLFGVELPDTCPHVSSAAQDRSSITLMVMLTCPSALGRGALMGLVVRMGVEWLPRGTALGSCPFAVDCRISTGRQMGSPPSMVVLLASNSGRMLLWGPHIHWAPLGRWPGNLSWGAGRLLVGWSFSRWHC